MSGYSTKIRQVAAIAARNAITVAATVLALIVVRVILHGLLEGKWGFDWRWAASLSAIVGGMWFSAQFILTLLKLCSIDPAKAILSALPSSIDAKSAMVGFVAMEYFGLILNRTYVVFIAPEALYGWKARGPVTNMQSMYFQPYVQMLNNPALMHDREAVQKLAELKGGFVIARSQILGIEFIRRNKWGMGGIPHTGRIQIRIASGRTREFILLGNVVSEGIQREILSGAPVPAFEETDAVGTIIAERPPHRSVRALLRIRLPPWMSGEKAGGRIRMQDTWSWKPPREDREEPTPR
jgi:hypothetical protein